MSMSCNYFQNVEAHKICALQNRNQVSRTWRFSGVLNLVKYLHVFTITSWIFFERIKEEVEKKLLNHFSNKVDVTL